MMRHGIRECLLNGANDQHLIRASSMGMERKRLITGEDYKSSLCVQRAAYREDF
jgi:hypothetical protein